VTSETPNPLDQGRRELAYERAVGRQPHQSWCPVHIYPYRCQCSAHTELASVSPITMLRDLYYAPTSNTAVQDPLFDAALAQVQALAEAAQAIDARPFNFHCDCDGCHERARALAAALVPFAASEDTND